MSIKNLGKNNMDSQLIDQKKEKNERHCLKNFSVKQCSLKS